MLQTPSTTSTSDRSVSGAMINDYVLEREPLSHAVVLIDANVGPTALYLQTIDWLRDIDLSFAIVGTKVDKIKSVSVLRSRRRPPRSSR